MANSGSSSRLSRTALSSDSGWWTSERADGFRQTVHTPRLVSSDSMVYWKLKNLSDA